MIRNIFKIIRCFPEQVFLFVFNSSIFAWLWQSGSDIADRMFRHPFRISLVKAVKLFKDFSIIQL